MSKITPISGRKEELCQYCGLVPQSEHPGYSCPRIASFAWADGELSVEYVDFALWTHYTEVMRARKVDT
jgi:hypothetical protein